MLPEVNDDHSRPIFHLQWYMVEPELIAKFRIKTIRRQLRSDDTISQECGRFEIPFHSRSLEQIPMRYTRLGYVAGRSGAFVHWFDPVYDPPSE